MHSISIQDTSESENEAVKKVSSIHLKQMAELTSVEWSVDLNYFKLPTSSKRYVLTPDEQSYLSGVYSLMYPEETITAINITGQKYTHVSGPVFIFGSNGKSSQRNSYVLANWPQQSLVNTDNHDDYCPGQVQYFVMHSVTINSELHPHLFAMYSGMSLIQMITSKVNLYKFGIRITTKHVVHQPSFRFRELQIASYFIVLRTQRK